MDLGTVSASQLQLGRRKLIWLSGRSSVEQHDRYEAQYGTSYYLTPNPSSDLTIRSFHHGRGAVLERENAF
ncbi:hypothetical protein BDW60DRAFT_181773 [Aspergillus nidulans var. acristatus]